MQSSHHFHQLISSPLFIGIAGVLIGLAVVLIILTFSWWLTGCDTEQKFDRRKQAYNAASALFAEITQTYTHFESKYMPLAVSKLLLEAGSVQRDLEQRALEIERQAQLIEIVREANSLIAGIRLEVAVVFTAEAMESERLALIAELAEVEELATAERAEAEAAHQKKLAQIAARLERARHRIERSQGRLAALVGQEEFKLLCQGFFEHYIDEVQAYANGHEYIMDKKSGKRVPVCEESMGDVEAYLHLPDTAEAIKKFRTGVLIEIASYAVKNQTTAIPYTCHSTLRRAIEPFVRDRIGWFA